MDYTNIVVCPQSFVAEFNLSEKQADAILDINLRRLAPLEVHSNYSSNDSAFLHDPCFICFPLPCFCFTVLLKSFFFHNFAEK